MCSIADANGAPTADYTFEDYLQNVPNVIGTSGSDVIICDNGVDTITHGSGAGDIFYAGAGAGSQDTFVYTAMKESPLSNHDIIEGFKTGEPGSLTFDSRERGLAFDQYGWRIWTGAD
jgi:hypothetical protein